MMVSVQKRTSWLGLLFFIVGMLLLQLTLTEEREVPSVVPLRHDVGEGQDAMVLRDKSIVHGSVVAKDVDVAKRQHSAVGL